MTPESSLLPSNVDIELPTTEATPEETPGRDIPSHHEDAHPPGIGAPQDIPRPLFTHTQPHRVNEYQALIVVPVDKFLAASVVIGPGGSQVKQLTKRSACYISLAGDGNRTEIIIHGHNEHQVSRGVDLVCGALFSLIFSNGQITQDHAQWILDTTSTHYFRQNNFVGTKIGPPSEFLLVPHRTIKKENHVFYIFIPDIKMADLFHIIVGDGGVACRKLKQETGCHKIHLTAEEKGSRVSLSARCKVVAERSAHHLLHLIRRELGNDLRGAFIKGC